MEQSEIRENKTFNLQETLKNKGFMIEVIETEKGSIKILTRFQPDNAILQTLYGNMIDFARENNCAKLSGRKDCADVAGKAINSLKRVFLSADIYLSTIGTGGMDGRIIPLYKRLGFRHHLVNLAIGEGFVASIDFTAKYTLDEEIKTDILVVVEDSEFHLLESLQTISGSKWEVRD